MRLSATILFVIDYDIIQNIWVRIYTNCFKRWNVIDNFAYRTYSYSVNLTDIQSVRLMTKCRDMDQFVTLPSVD